MSSLPKPHNELQRVAKLHSYDILDTEAEIQFDDLTTLAAQIFNVPICLVSLIDEKRQWFKSKVGLDVSETSRELSFCQYAIMGKEIVEVEDAYQDERFKNNPLVTGQPEIRFYAGAPLIDDEGLNIGTLCVIDRKPKKLDENQKVALKALARTVLRIIQFRKINEDQKKYTRFFNLALDMLCIAGTDGFFKYLNPAFTKVLGWSEKELLSKPFMELVHPNDASNTLDQIEKASKGALIIGFENRFKRKDGGWTWLSWTAQPDTTSGQLFAVAHDISELRETHYSLKQAKEIAERSSKAKDVFLSNVSHEIRTPLNAVIGFTDLLKKTALNEEQSKYLDTVSVASRNLILLIDDLLDVSRIESGKLELEYEGFSIKELIHDVIELQTQSARSKDLKLLSTIDHETPELVLGDYTRLLQILMNLVSNAIKFTHQGHIKLKVSVENVNETEAYIFFAVKDTGIGIEKGNLKKIFKRFTQADSSTARKYGGTGLGLNIVKMLVNLHDGEIVVDSEPGKGSEFSFKIKYRIANIGNGRSVMSPVSNDEIDTLNGLNILLVEDNEQNQILASTYIKRNNGFLDLAENGQEAIDKLKRKQYDVILMDLQMPIMDGFEATRIIREKLHTNIPIIACSAHSLDEEKQNCLRVGMNDYITKPYSELELITTIKVHFKKENQSLLPDNPGKSENFRNILKSLEDDGGAEFADAMLEVFQRRTPENISDLEKALNKNQMDVITRKAHSIAGSLANMRFMTGSKLAKKTEIAAREGKTEEADFLAKNLIHYLKNALREVNK